MNILGLSITRRQAVEVEKAVPASLSTVSSSRGGWYPIWSTVREAFAGAWQRNIELQPANVLSFSAVYACVTLIAQDIGKLRIQLVKQDDNGIWQETESAAFSPVLRKPNRYQTRIKFIEQWMTSKLIHGNTYVLKQRDQRGVVVGLYVLDPMRCRPMVAEDGSVFYAIGQDNLSQVSASDVVIPASEIIHDVMVALYHPLVGISPISACGLAAIQGLRVQNNSLDFFGNGSNPGGLLIAETPLSPEEATNLREMWESQYGGQNAGRTAVLGNGLKFQQLSMSAVDAQLIEQLKWTAENVCTAFHVPPFKIGVAPAPPYNNVEALNQQYYSDCLQTHIESIELLLDEGIGLDQQTPKMGTEFDLDQLLRMDSATRLKAATDAIKSGASPNECRKTYHGLGPVEGGDLPFLQEQNWPISLLAARQLPERPPTPPAESVPADDEAKALSAALYKRIPLLRSKAAAPVHA